MRQIKNEIGDEMLPNSQPDEGNGGSASGVILKKGPWTSAEDAILVDYVRKHGEGNWNAVQKHSGLSRCGKSCRLRWANHLRPNLKKGAFTAEEERLIAELHAKMGNKWARMAVHLPGRTDNEIKNYWNTRIKRRQRACLPLYPPEVCMQALCKSQHGQSTDGIDGGDGVQHGFLQQNSSGMHEAILSSLEDNQGMLPYMPGLSEISSCNMLLKGLGSSQYCNFVTSTFPDNKRLQEPTMPYLGSSGMNRNDGFHPFDHIRDNTSVKIAQSFGMHSPLDPGHSSHSTICYSHSLSNGNSSTSKPTSEAVKLELPSLQYPEIDLGSWHTYSPPPLLESVDDFIQSPPPICALESDCSSPPNSGLLDAMLYQAKTLSSSKNHYSDKSSISSTATPGDKADSSTLNLHETEWGDYADTLSPFGATSILNECPPVNANGNSLDKQPPLPSLSGNMESVDQVWTPESETKTMFVLNITRPDILLASDWHEHGSGHDKNQTIMTDAIANLLGNDLATDYQHGTSGTSKSSQVEGVGSCACNKYARGLSSI